MATRLAVLILVSLAAASGCAREANGGSGSSGCSGCHRALPAQHPAQAGSCTSCHRGDPDAERQSLAHHMLITGAAAEHALAGSRVVAAGKVAVERLACRRCHVVGTVGNRLATPLDTIVWAREQAALARSIDEPVESMPRFAIDPATRQAVIAYLLAVGDREQSAPTYRVRFTRRSATREDPFELHCAGCHRALTARGPLGRGSAGPNLSGLLSGHFPSTAAGEKPWDEALLRDWLANPRRLRPATTMRPLEVAPEELRRIAADLGRGG